MRHCCGRRGTGHFLGITGLSVLIMGLILLLLWSPWENRGIARGKKLVVFCAAGLAKPVTEIRDTYQKRYGVEIHPTFGGTGQILGTLRATGGKGDLFIAADSQDMELAQKEGLVREVIPVGYQRPVLVVNKATQERLVQKGNPVTGIQDLLRQDLKVVLANPEIAAIGKVVKKILESPPKNLWRAIDQELKGSNSRISTTGTVNEVLQTVRARDGFLGVVWSPLALGAKDIALVEAPEFASIREPVLVGILAGASGDQVPAALAFARFLTAGDEGGLVFRKAHFELPPDPDSWAEHPLLNVAAGSMLKPSIEEVIRGFSAREGVTINTQYGGCGVLVSQMRALKNGDKSGQFPDAYFACDWEFLQMVEPWFAKPHLVSKNRIGLLVQKGNPKKIAGLSDLARKDLRIGLAHPQKAALGKLSEDLLKKNNLLDRVYHADWQQRLVHGEAGHDLVNKIRIKALDVALVYESNARATPESLTPYMDFIGIDKPEAWAVQPFAVSRETRHKYLVERLFRAIVSDQSADRFRSLGFDWVYERKLDESGR